MRHTGWYDRPGVRILEGRWQDFFSPPESDANISTKPIDIGKFDVVYFDTFHEGYRGHFAFIKHVPRLLRGLGSRFSYFNGHAEKHETQYRVCCIR
jgi:protein arginine N-methyltransferase 2